MLDLTALFASLRPLSTKDSVDARFSAISIPGYTQHRLGKDAHGAPSLLITVASMSGAAMPPPTVLEHLTVQHDVTCRIQRMDGKCLEGRFTVVRCLGNDPAMPAYFLQVAEALIVSLGVRPSANDVTRAIDQLVELFRAMTAAPRKSVQGLWAEMLLMALAPDPAVAVYAWHGTPEDRYDFNMDSQRIEVKSAANRVRAHQFSLEQLSPPLGTMALIASLFVERAGAGQAVADLVREVRGRIGDQPELLLHLDQVVGQTLGSNWQQAADIRFDRELAESSLAYFASSDVPRITLPVPANVSAVHFTSNLIDLIPGDIAPWLAMGGLFEAMLRQ